jgi:hypothetical protein
MQLSASAIQLSTVKMQLSALAIQMKVAATADLDAVITVKASVPSRQPHPIQSDVQLSQGIMFH